MHEHFNATVGMPISSNAQFDAELRRKSDEAEARTGIPHKFVRHDPRDAKSFGVTNQGMDSTNKVRAEKGLRPINFEV